MTASPFENETAQQLPSITSYYYITHIQIIKTILTGSICKLLPRCCSAKRSGTLLFLLLLSLSSSLFLVFFLVAHFQSRVYSPNFKLNSDRPVKYKSVFTYCHYQCSIKLPPIFFFFFAIITCRAALKHFPFTTATSRLNNTIIYSHTVTAL